MLLSEEERLLRDSAVSFFEGGRALRPREMRELSANARFDCDLWRKMADMGWTATPWPSEYGGLDFGYRGLGLVMQEAGRKLAFNPLLSSVWLCGSLVHLAGTEAQKEDILPGIATSSRILALALDEQTKHDPARISTTATPVPGGYLISGKKRFVIDGGAADTLIVVARPTDEPANGLLLLMVDPGLDGVEIRPVDAIDPRDIAEIELDEVFVPRHAMLGTPQTGADALERALDTARIGLAAEILGCCEEALQRTIDYIKVRKQFGVALGSFQSLKHRCADMYCQLRLASAALYEALSALDDGRSAPEVARLASIAKAKIGKSARTITREAVQMHGGIAMTEELDIGYFLKRAAFAEQALGGVEFHTRRFARLEGY